MDNISWINAVYKLVLHSTKDWTEENFHSFSDAWRGYLEERLSENLTVLFLQINSRFKKRWGGQEPKKVDWYGDKNINWCVIGIHKHSSFLQNCFFKIEILNRIILKWNIYQKSIGSNLNCISSKIELSL